MSELMFALLFAPSDEYVVEVAGMSICLGDEYDEQTAAPLPNVRTQWNEAV